MGEREFNLKYNEAIVKIAIGFYILDTAGSELDFTPVVIESNKCQLCDILAQGITLPATTIREDVNHTRANLSASYIDTLHRSGIMNDLVVEMRTLKLI